MVNELTPSQIRVGQLIDGEINTPYQSCALTYERGSGPVLSVPYVTGEPQFEATTTWFHRRQPPLSLLFVDDHGTVTLTRIRWHGYSGFRESTGRLAPELAIFGRPRSLKAEYKVRQLASRLDGLHHFSQYRSVHFGHEPSASNQVVVTIRPDENLSWRHDGFTYRIRATAPWNGQDGHEFSATSDAVLETNTHRGATVDDHVTAQWPMRALLILCFGSELYWREHRIVDSQFPTWMIDGTTRSPSHVLVQFRRTIRDLEQPEPVSRELAFPMFYLSDLGNRGLRRWFSLYQDPILRRAIEPAVEVINGASRFIEPQMMMASLALEAMGHYLDPQRRRNQKLADQVERCIAATKADWSAIGPDRGVAIAIANTNNDLKHPDRTRRPDGLELQLIANLAIVIVRMQLFELLGLPEKVRDDFLRSGDVRRAIDAFRINGISIDSGGALLRENV